MLSDMLIARALFPGGSSNTMGGVTIPRVTCESVYYPNEMEFLTVPDDAELGTHEKLEYAIKNNLPILFNVMINYGEQGEVMSLLMHQQRSVLSGSITFAAALGPIILQLTGSKIDDQYVWEFSQFST